MRYTPTPVCDARSARWQNRPGGVPENLTKNAAPEAVDLLRTGTRELHHGPGRLQPHIEAEYICADGQPVALITLVRRGRTIHFQHGAETKATVGSDHGPAATETPPPSSPRRSRTAT